jgi:hypothetical protein
LEGESADPAKPRFWAGNSGPATKRYKARQVFDNYSESSEKSENWRGLSGAWGVRGDLTGFRGIEQSYAFFSIYLGYV